MTTENKSRELQVQHFNHSAKLKDIQPHFHTSNVQTGLKKQISLSQTTEKPVFLTPCDTNTIFKIKINIRFNLLMELQFCYQD